MIAQYLKTHCQCGGGIEFPAEGAGQKVACPHCGNSLVLKADVSIGPKLSRGGLFFLTKFRFRTEVSDLDQPGRWDGVLDASPSMVVNQFVRMGLLEPVKLTLAELVGRRSRKELQELCKARGLVASGTKDKMAKRLAEADPAGMEKLVNHGTFFHCTAKGRELAEAFIQANQVAEQTAIAQATNALRQTDADEACRIIAEFKHATSVSRDPAPARIDPRDSRVLKIILGARLKRHSSMDETQMKNLGVAAGMMHLMGTNHASPYLEEGLNHSDIDWNLESRQLLSRGLEAARLDDMKRAGIKRVEVLGSGECPACAADSKRAYNIDRAPLLPHEDCTCDGGCACLLTAKLK